MRAERSGTNLSGNVSQNSTGSVWRIALETPPVSQDPPDDPDPPANVDPEPRKLTVSDATVTEAPGAQLVFTVSLDRAPATLSEAVTVDYATSDVTAIAGLDYTLAVGTLTFGVGDQTQSANVAVFEDDLKEGSETMQLKLSNAVGATISSGTGTGTINDPDPDPGPKAWLSRFGRAVAGQVLDGVAARLEADRTPGGQATIAGQTLLLSDGAAPQGGTIAFDSHHGGAPGAAGPGLSSGFGSSPLDLDAQRFGGTRTMDVREALRGRVVRADRGA